MYSPSSGFLPSVASATLLARKSALIEVSRGIRKIGKIGKIGRIGNLGIRLAVGLCG